MTLPELQREAASLSPEEQRRLMGFLAGLQISRDDGPEIRRRFTDRRPGAWIPAGEIEQRLRKEH